MPIAKKKEVPLDFINQMKSNLSKSEPQNFEEPPAEPSPAANVIPTQSAPEKNPAASAAASTAVRVTTAPKHSPAKEKYADVMNIRLSKGRRNEIKAFCTNCGVSITQYIESSFEFFAKEVAAGNIVISKGGITKVTH